MSPNDGAPKVLVDYKKNDYRGFIFVLHEEYGLLMLQCSRKKNKPVHWQVPGGHVDDFEFVNADFSFKPLAFACQTHVVRGRCILHAQMHIAAKKIDNAKDQLVLACQMGATRELFEETGIDVRSELGRVEPANLCLIPKENEANTNEHKNRLFYFLFVTDRDFPSTGVGPFSTTKQGNHLKLNISKEHSGFTFESDWEKAANLLMIHSGGKVSEAFRMFVQCDLSIRRRLTPYTDGASELNNGVPTELLIPAPKKNSGGCCCFGNRQ